MKPLISFPRILHVLTSPRAEGTPRLVLDWTSVPGFFQHVHFLRSTPADLWDEFSASTASISVGNVGSRGFSKYRESFAGVMSVIRDVRPDVLISWNMGLATSIVLAAYKLKVPALVHFGNVPEIRTPYQVFYNYFNSFPITLFSGKIICASDHIRNTLLRLPLFSRKKVFKVYNCIRLATFIMPANAGIIRRKDLCVNVGNLDPVKNQGFLIEVWKDLTSLGYNPQLRIIGGGKLFDELLGKISSSGLDNRVSLLGASSEVHKHLWESNIFIFPTSSQEGFGTVLIEALVAGCRIIASDVPACREVLQGGRYGLLVEPGNVRAFSKAIIEIMDSESNTASEVAVMDYTRQFSPERMVREYLAIAGLS